MNKLIVTKKVVIITDWFSTPIYWEKWKDFFEHEHLEIQLFPFPVQGIGQGKNNRSNSLAEELGFYEKFIESLPNKPIVIGHAMGGLIVQLLVNKGIVSAGVAIHPFPPGGSNSLRFRSYLTYFNYWLVSKILKTDSFYSFYIWRNSIANGMSLKEQLDSYNNFNRTNSFTVLRGWMDKKSRINFKISHPPLLIIAGGTNKIISASINYANFKTYKHAFSLVTFKEFETQNHLVIASNETHETTDYILQWLLLHG